MAPNNNNNNNNNTSNNNSNNSTNNNSNNSNNKEPIEWDSYYEEDEEDLGNLESHGSVITHLLSQIRIGMDLTKVVLPTFILERRSLLEMYADFFAHPDLFSTIADQPTPEARMIQLVKWYLSAFHAGRRSSVAKKPYNPILGEVFLCHWNLNCPKKSPATPAKADCNDNANNGNNRKVASSDPHSQQQNNLANSRCSPGNNSIEEFTQSLPPNSLLFVAEQVSHHPPVSALYAENRDKLISCCAHIYTKSKYLGFSVGVHNIGQGKIELLSHGETYTCTFPSAYGRSILTVPWVELGGSVDIACEKTGYTAKIEFVTKPIYGGRKHRITGEILGPNRNTIRTIEGEWNGIMYSKTPNSSDKRVFVDTLDLPVIEKRVRPISSQEDLESRNVWKEVTRALKMRDVGSATTAKSAIEQRQRDQLKERTEKGTKWEPRYFQPMNDGWIYKRPLAKRPH